MMRDLIVDFPSEATRLSKLHRRTQEIMIFPTPSPTVPITTPTNKTPTIPKRKTPQLTRLVRFCETSTMIIIERASQSELARRWYSHAERAEFKLRLRADVLAALYKLESASATAITTAPNPIIFPSIDDIYECVGIELFLSRDIFAATPRRRFDHVRYVLEAQSRHNMRLHSFSNAGEELERISKQSSEWICTRCHTIAAMYWMANEP